MYKPAVLVLLLNIVISKAFHTKNAKSQDDRSSLVFVFDTTGSMHDDLKQLREGAEMILDAALEANNTIADFVFVPFHDPAVGPPTVTRYKSVFKDALSMVRVYGGGDCPEKSLTGIQLALNVSRPRSFVYVFTDATAQDHKLVGKVLDTIQRKQSQVVFVLTGHCNDLKRPSYLVYQQIAAASSGQVFNLNKTSVHKVLDFVRSSIKARTVNLASMRNPAGYNYTQGIPVDSSLGEVTVSVSGSNPRIKVYSPTGQLTGPPKLVTTIDLAEIMVVKVLQPEPGNWSILVGSEEEHSVKVVGQSNLTFQHGFSVHRPTSVAETSYRPLKGTYNYMLISLTQTDKPVHISFAEILSLDGKVLFEIPLKEVDPVKKVYLADAFVPPDEFFYISINGLDRNNQELRRVGATAIQAKASEVPYLSAPKKVEAHSHETVTLKCDIESLVPVTSLWTKDGTKIQQISSLQSTSIEYVIENMAEEHAGTYSCVARNSAGVSHHTTEVILLVEPPVVTISASNKILSVGERLTVSCSVLAETLLTKYQLIFTGKRYTNVTDIRVEPNYEGVYLYNMTQQVKENDGGEYTCVAAHRGGQTSKSLNITVSPLPIARILGPHTLTKSLNTVIQLICDVEHTSELQWLYNGVIVEKRYGNDSFNAILDTEVKGDGVWTCVAVQGRNKVSDSVEIIALIKPEVSIKESKDITIFNGTIYNITCSVKAKPQPRIIWHKETENFLNNNVTKLSPILYQSVLTINSTKGAVEGTYFCFGENSEGINQDRAIVRVRRKMVLVRGFTDISTELHSNVTLYCEIDSYPKAKMQWFHNFTELVNKPNVQVHENSIFIEKINFDNLGFYSCEASNRYERVTVNGTLSVRGLELPVLFKEPKKRITQKGNTTVLTCSILKGNPKPSVTWYRTKPSGFEQLNGDIIKNADRTEIVISKVRIDQAGVYRCVAENILGRDFHDIILEVQFPPEIKSDLPNKDPLEIKVGSKVSLPCKVTGNPTPIVIWTKNGEPVVYTENAHLTTNSDLVIEEVHEFDSGSFSCYASSPLGYLWKNYTVLVYEPPKITPPGIEPRLEFLEGQLVELPCFTTGLPRPRVIWLQNGHRVDDRKYIDDFGIRFVANLTDFGEYTCVVENMYGKTNFTYSVFIWVPPSIKPPLKTEVNALVGSNVSLRCDAVGFPVPIIYWKFQDERILVNSTSFSFDNYGNVNITQITLKQDGRYSCMAENLGGVAGIDFYLHVNEPPRILDDNYTGRYIATDKDSLLMVSCKAAGKPRPYVYWTKDDVVLDKDSRYNIDADGTLTIKSPAKEQSGEYTCVAKNIVGVANKTVAVEVYSLPSHQQAEESESTVTLLEGSRGLVECPLKTSPGDVVTWYKDAKLISTGLLSIPNVSRDNASTLACVATNAVGSAFAKLHFVVEWPPRFATEEQRQVEVVKGGDVWLKCEVDAKPKAKTKWLFNSIIILGEDKDRLKLINIQLHQTGVYKCIASNPHGTIVKQFTVDVLVPPFISVFDLLDVQLKVGMSTSLECHARGSPKPEIKWTYNNAEWRQTNSSLTASNVSSLSEGLYRCDAVNKAGASHLIYRVAIVAPSKVDEVVMFGEQGVTVEETAEVVIGSNVRIACKALGQPIPTIQWIKNGHVISQNRKDISYADLVLENVDISHSGMYVCIASNDGGVDDKRIKVDVLDPPKIYQTLFQNSNSTEKETILEVISGQAFNLHCHVYGNPVPDVFWFKNGIPLRLFDDTMISSDFGEVIQSPSARLEQSGNYTCVARNKVGNTSIVYLVDVLVPPPTPKEASRPIDIRVDKSLVLTCPVEGSPTPSVTWLKHPYTELTATARLILSNDNVTMTIPKTETSDSGLYSCIMSNKVGTTEAMFHVTVLKPPSIAGNTGTNITETRVVPLHRSLVLKCEVDGHPTPKISWLKDTQQLTGKAANVQQVLGNSLLAVWSMASRAAGQYICVAENSAGSAHRRYNVVAQGKWTAWSQWSYCNVTCGLGYQAKSRACRYEDDYLTLDDKTKSDKAVLDKSACKGPNRERRKCHMPPCEDETIGQWSGWSKWGVCSSSCDAGTQARTRRCRGGQCAGDNVQLRKCPNLPKCDANRVLSENENNKTSDEGETESIENNPYVPEATFEFDPKVVDAVEDIPSESSSPVYEVRPAANPQQGPCGPGYTHNETTQGCDDIDECTIENNHCHSTQVCINTAGGYRCGCEPGYFALSAGQRCLDINECEQDIDGCEFACVNVAGGYACACPRHLRLHADRHHCVLASSYRDPYVSLESEYLSAVVESPAKYKNTRN